MSVALDSIDTIYIAILENRSFDHMLGYLSLPPYSRANVEGLRTDPTWASRFANLYANHSYAPFHLTDPRLPADPPHDRAAIARQLGSRHLDASDMQGFVANYASVHPVDAINNPPAVMGYYTPAEIPISDFFAQNFGIGDHWFAPLPTGTQANRLMAMAGTSVLDDNAHLLPDQPLVYDWLSSKKIRWRVYHDGLPFFSMMLRWLPAIAVEDHFRDFSDFAADAQEQSPREWPQVVFFEPTYTDAPHLGRANDDHPPSSIRDGQEFLRQVYQAVTADPVRWSRSLLIVTYDENGGFFDHVSPPSLSTQPPAGATYVPFTTAGVRVPVFFISPWVSPKSVLSAVCDHTSILKLLGEKFGGGSYSAEVDARNVASASVALDLAAPRVDLPVPPLSMGYSPALSVNAVAFHQAAQALAQKHPDQFNVKFPELNYFVKKP